MTRSDAKKIRTRYAKGDVSYRTLAKEYGYSRQMIFRVLKNEKFPDKNYIYVPRRWS